ncbi:DNA repair protein RadC [Tahibacter sp. UC22_41]|uniref:RadC family protein n=1 Tax=Tahibacter sp. UC22_41 TaxID=3350178 RepID=UPI002CDD47E3|nr:DNA repair protein RadC [Tahibacter sp.]
MNISQWPVEERPREKLLSQGAAALSDAELLAIFLGSGSRGQTAVDLGRRLLVQSGGLRALFVRTEPLPELCGLGPAKGCRLQAVLEVARRCLGNDLKRRSTLRSPRDTAAFLRTRMSDYPYEVFAAVFLDNRHRVIAFEEMFRGTIDGTAVHPREVVRACLRHNAAAVIFAHNHPSGVAEPSESDREITCELREALALVGVRVLDHFIVGTESPVSMAQKGWL